MMASGPVDEDTNVRVAARIRPLLPREQAASCCSCVSVQKDSGQVVVGTRRAFAFDIVFDQDESQQQVYDGCAASLLTGCLQGYNATVFAYGQTGSGKTFTMGTGQPSLVSHEEEGITPKVIRNSFAHMEKYRDEVDFKASCCYLEIYNEEIRDLLQPNAPKHLIAVRENTDGVIQVAGIHAEECSSAEDMLRCLNDGSVQRTTGATLMNEQSSRSHSIFTIILEQRSGRGVVQPLIDDADSGGGGSSSSRHPGTWGARELTYKTAKFHLVDLAGSERAKRTGAIGSRLKESVAINSGLLALGNVISALGDPGKRGSHVPYRESKLTRILQDSLGGNSRTWMLACASCADSDFEETLNTLKYAHRARNIKNKPVVNHDPRVAQLAAMQDEILALRSELQRVSEGGPMPSPLPLERDGVVAVGTAEVTEKLEAAERRALELTDKLVSAETDCEALRRCLADVYVSFCHYLPTLPAAGTTPPATPTPGTPSAAPGSSASTGGSANGRQQALAAICEALQAARQLMGEAVPCDDSGRRLETDEVPPLPDLVGAAAAGIEGGVYLDRFVDASAADIMETSRLSTLSEVRKDSTPLIRKYLEEIQRLEDEVRRLEGELVLHRRRNKQLQEELLEAKEDLQKDEDIFEEKMREMKLLQDRNEAMEIELQELAAGAAGRCNLFSDSANARRGQAPMVERLEETDEVRTDELELEFKGLAQDSVTCSSTAKGGAGDTVYSEVDQEMRESQAAQQRLEAELQALEQNIILKEDQIAKLIEAEREWNSTKAAYQRRMEQLQCEYEGLQQECRALQDHMEDSAHGMDASRQVEEEKRSLERHIAEHVEGMRRQKAEFSRLREQRLQDRARIKDLEAEVEQFQGSIQEVERQLMAERWRASQLKKAGIHEPAQAQQGEQSRRRPSNVGQKAENVRRRDSLRRDPRESPSQSGTDAVAGALAASSSSVSRAQMLEQQIIDQMRRHEASQSLEVDVKKRDALLQKHKQYLSYRQKIAAKDATEQQDAKDRLRHLEVQIARLDRAEGGGDAPEHAVGTSAGGLDLEARERTRIQKEALAAERTELQRLSQGKHAESLSLLKDIDERLEGLQDEVDFREARITKARHLLHSTTVDAELAGVPAEDAKELLSRYCDKVLRLRQREKQNWKRLKDIEAQLEERGRQVAELQEVLRRQDANSTKAIAKVSKEYEGRIRLLCKQLSAAQQRLPNADEVVPQALPGYDAAQVAALAQRGGNVDGAGGACVPEGGGSIPSGDPGGVGGGGGASAAMEAELQTLRRDNQYYKATNRELKRRLREALERAGSGGARHSSAGDRVEEMAAQLERMQTEKEALCEEHGRVLSQVQVAKQYASRFHNIAPGGSGGRADVPME